MLRHELLLRLAGVAFLARLAIERFWSGGLGARDTRYMDHQREFVDTVFWSMLGYDGIWDSCRI